MDRISELQAIAAELRALTVRVDALIKAETANLAEAATIAANPAEAEPETQPEAEPKPTLTLPLNDRYRFQRELFGGLASDLNSLIEKLAPMTSAAEVEAELTACGFDLENETVKDLLRLTTRRFDSHPQLLA